MSNGYNNNKSHFVRIVYSKVKINGKVQLVPLELYADGSIGPSVRSLLKRKTSEKTVE